MLLYDYDEARDNAIVEYINDGLKQGKLVIYASVDASDTSHIARLSSGITDYEKNLDRGDFLILNIRKFYDQALDGDLEPFRDLKVILEEAAKERTATGKRDDVVVVADCAENLSRNEKFATCFDVENWWQNTHFEWLEKNLRITVICPHQRPKSGNKSFMQHLQLISHLHSEIITALYK
jgi:RecA-superfamily ATPases implicated in signal transduction